MTGPPKPNIIRKIYPKVPDSYRAGPTGPLRRSQGYNNSPQSPLKRSLDIDRHTQIGNPQKLSRFQNWYMRNPRQFHAIALTIGLTIFFSRPIYDIFFRDNSQNPPHTKYTKNKLNI